MRATIGSASSLLRLVLALCSGLVMACPQPEEGNEAPVAVSDVVFGTQDLAQEILAADLLQNDLDAEGATLRIISVTAEDHCEVVLDNETISFVPEAAFAGAAHFAYLVTDGSLTDVGRVTVQLAPLPQQFQAENDILSGVEDQLVQVSAAELLANDTGNTASLQAVSGAVHGTVSLENNLVSFLPEENFNGFASFLYIAEQGDETDTAVVTIALEASNDAPTTAPDLFVVEEDQTLQVGISDILSNDNDVDGELLSLVSIDNFVGGTALLQNTQLSFVPIPDFTGDASFSYSITDGTEIATSTVVVRVTPVNDAPVALEETVSLPEDTTRSIALVAEDPDNLTLEFSLLVPPLHGTLSGTAPLLLYTPDANFHGSDSFFFEVSDGLATSNLAEISIEVLSVNDTPTAENQTVSLAEDTSTQIALVGADADNDTISFEIIGLPTQGELQQNENQLLYIPFPDANGEDSFSFQTNDGTETSSLATVSLSILPVNDAPVAEAQQLVLEEDTLVGVTLSALDVDGDNLRFSVVSQPSNGSLSGTAPNLIYLPNRDFHGNDLLTFLVTDGSLVSTLTTISLAVTPANDIPIAEPDELSVQEDNVLTSPKALLLTNDVDIDRDTLSVVAVSAPLHGSVVLNGNNIVFTPEPNFQGLAGFSYTASDGSFLVGADVDVFVLPVNDAPVAVDDTFSVAEDTALQVPSAQLLGNDTDVDIPSSLAVLAVSNAQNGTVSLSGGIVSFVPNANVTGVAQFDYTLSDGLLTDTGTVLVNISPVNDAPQAASDTIFGVEDQTLSIAASTLLANDTDIDSATLSILAVGNLEGGIAALSGNSVLFVPDKDRSGSARFSYILSDGALFSVGTVTVVLAAVNDPPVAVDDTFSVEAGKPLVLLTTQLTANDVDVDTAALVVVAVENAVNLGATLSGQQILISTQPNSSGLASFDYIVSDGSNFDVGRVEITLVAPLEICGDAVLTATEECDDGNLISGDGCSLVCTLEIGSEQEPNGLNAPNDFGVLSRNGLVAGDINPIGDNDFFILEVPSGVNGRIIAQILDGQQGSVCANLEIDSALALFDSSNNLLVSDDDGGTELCSLLFSDELSSGVYILQAKASSLSATAIFDYTLFVSIELCGDGLLDSAEQCDDGNILSGDGCSTACVLE